MIPPIAHQGKPLRVGSEQIGTAAGRGCGKVGPPPAGRSKVVDGNSAAAGDGVISFRLIDREIFVFQTDGAGREDDPQRNCCRNDEFQSDRFMGHRGCSL
jgi:hypothetical protein